MFRRLQFIESLEARQLLAADLVDVNADSLFGVGESAALLSEAPVTEAISGFQSSLLEQPEGEPQVDLAQFAKDLAAADVIFYGADWCRFCNEQKALFSDGAEYLPFVEVTNADHSLNGVGQAAGIETFPTWDFPTGGGGVERRTGVLTLETLSQLSGVPIPTGETPSILPIDDVQLQSATPQHIGIDAYDPNIGVESEAFAITVSSSNPAVVDVSLVQGNRSAVITVEDWGTMTVELFEQRAPIPTERFITIANAGGFDENPFHRIATDFVIQAGLITNPPDGLDTSTIVDDFHPELQHGQSGALSYAKTESDDSGTTQFFVTDGPAPHLDFNHPVFGQLTEGEGVRKGLQRAVTDVAPSAPVISTVEIVDDNENGVIKLLPQAESGTATITVTVTDADGNQAVETFDVTVVADTSNAQPFLVDEPLLNNPDGSPQITTQENVPVTITLDAVDVENDPFTFTALGQTGVGTSINNDELTITPPADFIGIVNVRATTFQTDLGTVLGQDDSDSQIFQVAVAPQAPGVLSLVDGSDTGSSDSDNITNDTTPTVRVNGVHSGALVVLATAAGETLGQQTAADTFVDFNIDLTAFPEGDLDLVATQTVGGLESPESAALTVTLDTTPPDLGSDPAPASVMIGGTFTYDAETPEETGGNPIAYSLDNAESNMTIQPVTGVVEWIPTPIQRGVFEPMVVAADVAGNESMVQLDVTADGPTQLGFSLSLTDDLGDPIVGDIIVGSTFLVNVFVEDLSDSPTGVKNAYFDMELPNTWMREGDAIFGSEFTFDLSDLSDSLIDEVGAGAAATIPVDGPVLLAQLPNSISDGGVHTLQTNVADRDSELFAGVVDPNEILYGTLEVTAVSPFVANEDQRNVDEDSVDVAMSVLTNDEFIQGQTGTLSVVAIDQQPAFGVASIDTSGEVIYTPNANFNGADSFTYVITDDQQRGTVTGAVSIAVQPINDPPEAVDDSFTDLVEDSSDNDLDVLGNDTDVDGDDLDVIEVTQPDHGTVSISPNQTFVSYTPNPGFDGDDSFTYVATDGKGEFTTGTVSLSVAGDNDPPIAVADTAVVDEDDSVTIDVLANDDPVDGGDSLTIVSAVATQGNAAVVNSEEISYSPAADFNGLDVIEYVIDDGTGMTATAAVSVTVTPVNDAPVANDDPGSGDWDVTFNTTNNVLDILDNDTDVDGDTLTITDVSGFSDGGSATIVNGEIQYTPATDFVGVETFAYTIEDPSGESSSANVSVTVLEFFPASLAGVVFLDGDGDGIQGSGEAGLSGVVLALSGVDDLGNDISESTTTDTTGAYQFTGLRPGAYTITETQPAYFTDGDDTVGSQGGSVSSNDVLSVSLEEGVDGVGNNFAERGRAAGFRTIHDLFRSSSRTNVFAAVNMDTGEVMEWTEGDWTSPEVDVDYDETTGQISVTVDDGDLSVGNTFNVDSAPPAMVVGEDEPVRILRLLTQQNFDAAQTESPESESPESESPESEPSASTETPEGEPASVASAAAESLWNYAPLEEDESDAAGPSYQDAADAVFAQEADDWLDDTVL